MAQLWRINILRAGYLCIGRITIETFLAVKEGKGLGRPLVLDTFNQMPEPSWKLVMVG